MPDPRRPFWKDSITLRVCLAVLWDGAAVPSRGIGHMPRDNTVRAALPAFEVVLLGRLRGLSMRVAKRDLAAAEAAMTEIGVASLAHRRIGELSGGQRQLVLIAQVLAADPAVRIAFGVEVSVEAGPDGHPMVLPLRAAATAAPG